MCVPLRKLTATSICIEIARDKRFTVCAFQNGYQNLFPTPCVSIDKERNSFVWYSHPSPVFLGYGPSSRFPKQERRDRTPGIKRKEDQVNDTIETVPAFLCYHYFRTMVFYVYLEHKYFLYWWHR